MNDPARVFVARRGRHELTTTMLTHAEVRELVERMLKQSGRRFDLSTPFVDAMLPEGHRLHVVLKGSAATSPRSTFRGSCAADKCGMSLGYHRGDDRPSDCDGRTLEAHRSVAHGVGKQAGVSKSRGLTGSLRSRSWPARISSATP